ncbi:hypothetical protein NRB_48980 [Novosphingobium sp. 11B]
MSRSGSAIKRGDAVPEGVRSLEDERLNPGPNAGATGGAGMDPGRSGKAKADDAAYRRDGVQSGLPRDEEHKEEE